MYWHLCVVLVTRVCDYLEENSGASSQRIGTHSTSIQRKTQVLPRFYDGSQVTKGTTQGHSSIESRCTCDGQSVRSRRCWKGVDCLRGCISQRHKIPKFATPLRWRRFSRRKILSRWSRRWRQRRWWCPWPPPFRSPWRRLSPGARGCEDVVLPRTWTHSVSCPLTERNERGGDHKSVSWEQGQIPQKRPSVYTCLAWGPRLESFLISNDDPTGVQRSAPGCTRSNWWSPFSPRHQRLAPTASTSFHCRQERGGRKTHFSSRSCPSTFEPSWRQARNPRWVAFSASLWDVSFAAIPCTPLWTDVSLGQGRSCRSCTSHPALQPRVATVAQKCPPGAKYVMHDESASADKSAASSPVTRINPFTTEHWTDSHTRTQGGSPQDSMAPLVVVRDQQGVPLDKEVHVVEPVTVAAIYEQTHPSFDLDTCCMTTKELLPLFSNSTDGGNLALRTTGTTNCQCKPYGPFTIPCAV